MDKYYGVSLKSLQDRAGNTINEMQRIGKAVIDNTIDDIRLVYEGVEECAKEIDKIRIRAMHRAIEYHTLYQRTMRDLGIIPADLIDQVWRMVFGDIKGEAHPRIFHLTNPKVSVWEDTRLRNMVEVDISTINFPVGRAPFVFVHGAGKRGNELDAFSFYYSFEREARMFNNSLKDYSHADIFIVSYDSLITNNTRLIIKNAFESLLGPLTDADAPGLFSAVMWREWEERAEFTAEKVILPFLKKISESGLEPSYGAGAITHSLGCYALAHAAQLFVTEIPESSQRPFDIWFCMAAALPSNAFTRTGDFPLAPLIAGPSIAGPKHGTSVWFSNVDYILGLLYGVLANRHFAMGQTGALAAANDLTNLDVTNCVGIEHDDFKYFPLVQRSIRTALGTEIWSEEPDCALTLPNIVD